MQGSATATQGSATNSTRVALVHDFLLDLRGAERVFLTMCDIWPNADIFSAVYDDEGTEGRFAERNVYTSFLQRFHPTSRTFRALLPLYPAAVESFDLSGYDLVVSSSSAWAHGVICDEGAVHVSYCHNPFRYAWNERDSTISQRRNPALRYLLTRLFRRWRKWDWLAAQRVDRYVCNSGTTRDRIATYFSRDAVVVHPPVETKRFHPGDVSDYYLVLAELMPHKRIETAVHAFNRLRQPLLIVGDGPHGRSLRRLAGNTIQFTGRVSDAEVARLLRGCRALISTAVEEFGIAAVEAQASGRPVISVRCGGALETVKEGVTGAFWEGGPDDLATTVLEFDDRAIDPHECVENAARFDRSVFCARLPLEVEAALTERRDGAGSFRLPHVPIARRSKSSKRAIARRFA